LENLEEIDKFLDAYDLPKSNKEDINTFNISLMNNEIDAVIKVSQQRKSQDQVGSLANSPRPSKKK
jgi:hypothetical protein